MVDDEVTDHEDFAAAHGEKLQSLAEELCGDAEAATALVDATLADVWSQRHRVPTPEWPRWAQARLAGRWAGEEWWPDDHGAADVVSAPTDALITAGNQLTTRRAMMAGAAAGVTALGVGAWQVLERSSHGRAITVDGVRLHVSVPRDDLRSRIVRVARGAEVLTEFGDTRDRPLLTSSPLPDGRDLVAVWARGEVRALDLIGIGRDAVVPTTLVQVGTNTLALAVLGSGGAGSGGAGSGGASARLPLMMMLTEAGYRCEPPRVPQALVHWSSHDVTGYFVPTQGVFVLQEPIRQVVQGRSADQALVFVVPISAEAELLVVQTWSLVAAKVERGGRTITSHGQAFQNGALVSAIIEPRISPDHPVDVTVNGIDGPVSFRLEQ